MLALREALLNVVLESTAFRIPEDCSDSTFAPNEKSQFINQTNYSTQRDRYDSGLSYPQCIRATERSSDAAFVELNQTFRLGPLDAIA